MTTAVSLFNYLSLLHFLFSNYQHDTSHIFHRQWSDVSSKRFLNDAGFYLLEICGTTQTWMAKTTAFW